MRAITKAGLTLAATASALALVTAAAGPALAYKPPSVHLLCTAAANDATLEGSVCVLPFGVTTPPNSYSATIAVSNPGAGDTFAVVAGGLPPGLTMPATSGSGTVITGNPAKAGTFNFSIEATLGGLHATQAYQITVTVAGPPDQFTCSPAANGGFLISGACVLPDAVVGLPYQGHLPTSHGAGGSASVVAGTLPPGLSLPATFGVSGDTIGGTPGQPGIEPTFSFTAAGTGDQGQPLYQAYQITVDPNQPLAIVLPASGSTLEPGNVGQAFAQNFFLSGGAGPYAWSLVAGALPPGLTLQTTAGPRDAGNQLAGTPATAGTYKFTMKLTDYYGHQATQQFTLAIEP